MSRFDEIKEQLDGLIQRVDIDAALKLADIAAELIQMLEDIGKLPDEWRAQNRQSGWSFESDKGDELQAKLESK